MTSSLASAGRRALARHPLAVAPELDPVALALVAGHAHKAAMQACPFGLGDVGALVMEEALCIAPAMAPRLTIALTPVW